MVSPLTNLSFSSAARQRKDRTKKIQGLAHVHTTPHHNWSRSMRISKTGMLKVGLSLIALTVAAGVQAKTLVYCSEGSPEGFNPQLFTSGTTYDASSVPIYNRLVEFKIGTTEIQPGLAEKWEVSEDGKTYTFHLRKGVKWQTTKDFKPTRDFNADDVVFSFERQLDKNNKYHGVSGGSYEYFEGMDMPKLISKIEKVDDNTVRFVLTRPESPFLADLGMDFASVLSAEYADNMLKAGTPEKIDLNPVGTGPFQLVQYQKDSRILYKAFDQYWGTKPKIDRLVFSITPDASVRYAKLQKGECQVMPYPNPADIARMKEDKNINLMQMPGLNVGYLSFNTEKKPLDNLKVRQALITAVNKQAIIDAVYQGAGQAAKNLIPPTMWGYNDAVKDYTYDPAKAKELLKEAGMPDGFSIDLWAMPVQRPYNPNARRMAEMIQSDWAKIGVKAKIVTYEWGEYLKRAKAGEHQTVMMGWTGDNGDPDNFFATLFSCAAAKDGSNYSRWCYKPFEDQIQPARAEPDHNKRIEYYKQAQVVMHDQAPALIIAHSTVYEPVSKKVTGYVVDPLGKHHFENVDIQE
jgi:dipeptide transport system substrate-binding protein